MLASRFVMADDLDADWKQDHAAIMPSLTKHLKKGGIYFEVRAPWQPEPPPAGTHQPSATNAHSRLALADTERSVPASPTSPRTNTTIWSTNSTGAETVLCYRLAEPRRCGARLRALALLAAARPVSTQQRVQNERRHPLRRVLLVRSQNSSGTSQ